MSYIDRNLISGERIVFRTKKHIIIFLYPLLFTVFAIYVTNYMAHDFMLQKLSFVPLLLVLPWWIQVGFDYYFSEYAVTNKRVMMREGFIFRHTNELRINTISQVNIFQNILGQVLDYGSVSLNAFGADDLFPMVAKPNAFQKQVNEQLDQISQRSM